jgi:hypothetical protein
MNVSVFKNTAIGTALWLFLAGVLTTEAQTWSNPNLGGYLGVNYNGVANSYNAGYTMYVSLLGRPQFPSQLGNRHVDESYLKPWHLLRY